MNMKRALVILGSRQDPHVARVADEVERRGDTLVAVVDYLSDMRFMMGMASDGNIAALFNGIPLPANRLVWNRAKILAGTGLYTKGDEVTSGYSAQEWRALYTLLGGMNRKRLVNSLESKVCLIKPYQQIIAAGVGFLVPQTLVTNDKRAVLDFLGTAEHGLILKSLSGGKVKPAGEGESIPYNVMTMRVSSDDISHAHADELAFCPHFFQHEIQKSHEFRVVVVDREVMAFKIYSQAYKSSELDWRRGAELIKFEKAELGAETMEMIHAFMCEMGLFTGSIDLVVDRGGKTWFLECNQDGAWGWLDDIVNGDISRAFCRAFSRRLDELSSAADDEDCEKTMEADTLHG